MKAYNDRVEYKFENILKRILKLCPPCYIEDNILNEIK